MILNNSRAETFEDCRRKYFFSSEFGGTGLESDKVDENFAIGNIVHAQLARLYNEEDYINSLIPTMEEILNLEEMSWDEANSWMEQVEWFHRLLRSYDSWRKENDEFSVVQMEAEFCVPLGEICWNCGKEYYRNGDVVYPEWDPYYSCCPKCKKELHLWVGRIDLVENLWGDIRIMDHKTTKTMNENYLHGFHHNFQLIGYCYGYKKATGITPKGYDVNIIQKLATIGQENDNTKQCPACRNGKNKRLGCGTCSGAGRVQREQQPPSPFRRESETYTPAKAELFVRARLRTIAEIERERQIFQTDPASAFPMNPKSCFRLGRCPFWRFCWEGDPEKWYKPSDEALSNFRPRPADYVTEKRMAMEEMV